MTDRMQFTDLGSYQRIWRWMGECGDTHQQAGEVLFSTPNMHWPGQVARPGDWIVRTPTGFVAEPARPDCICPDDPTDLEGPRCPVHEVEQLKAELSTTEAALAEVKEERAWLEIEQVALLTEVREWMCDTCNTVYPGPPQEGIRCVVCPRCDGKTAPRTVIERIRLEAALAESRGEVERLTRALRSIEAGCDGFGEVQWDREELRRIATATLEAPRDSM